MAGRAHVIVIALVVSPDAVGAAGAGAAVAVPDPLAGSELPLLPLFFDRTWK